MDNFDIRDIASMDLFYAERLAQQLGDNHCLNVKDENTLTPSSEREYARMYACNAALVDIISEKIRHAKELIDKMAV